MQVLQARGGSGTHTARLSSVNFSCSYSRPRNTCPALCHNYDVHGCCACAAGSVMCSGSGGSRQPAPPRQSASHIFEERDRIGTGGSCDVYCGVQKGAGQRHALKVLRVLTPETQSQLLQEAETLSKLDSSKVVKFIGQNYEMGTGAPVVVLEHCEGGSLLSHLQQPENARGLQDEDFLTLLSDMVQGLNYLRERGIFHRDIKPGNILRHIGTSGKCEYKLSDFGTSREGSDTEHMTSIVGTEEYLHPVLYQNAFFRSMTKRSAISPTSGELWSLGCTLYHAVTASVPFRPLGGRNNKQAMLVMISEKPPGAVSGEQRFDGSVLWSKTLPSGCALSESLREKIVPLLQNLMETDPARQWSFATFLYETQRVLALHCFHVCDTECGHTFRLYMEPQQSLAELQDALAYHTELPAGQQLLFHRVQPVLTMLGARSKVSEMLVTLPDQPLLFVSAYGTEGRCRRYTPAEPQKLAFEATLEEDITASFRICSDLHLLAQMASTLYRLPNILFSAMLALRSALTTTLSTVETRFRVMSATSQERQSRLAVLSHVMDTLQPATSSDPHEKLTQARQLCDQLRDSLWQLKYRLDESRRSADSLQMDNSLCRIFTDDDSCTALNHMYSKAKDIWKTIQGRREKIPLSDMEQERHRADKVTLNEMCSESVQRHRHLQAKRVDLLEQYSTQIRQLCERVRKAQDVDSALQGLKEHTEKFSTLLNEVWAWQNPELTKMATERKESSSPLSFSPMHPVASPSPICNQLDELLSQGLPTLETFHIDGVVTPKNL